MSIVIDPVHPNALKPHRYSLHVLINYGRCAATAALHGTNTAHGATDKHSIDLPALRQSGGYCGSNAGFMTADLSMAHGKVSP